MAAELVERRDVGHRTLARPSSSRARRGSGTSPGTPRARTSSSSRSSSSIVAATSWWYPSRPPARRRADRDGRRGRGRRRGRRAPTRIRGAPRSAARPVRATRRRPRRSPPCLACRRAHPRSRTPSCGTEHVNRRAQPDPSATCAPRCRHTLSSTRPRPSAPRTTTTGVPTMSVVRKSPGSATAALAVTRSGAERRAQLGRGDGGVGVVRVRDPHDRRREVTLPGDGGGVDSRDALCGGRGDGLGVEVHGRIIHKAP